MLLCFLSVILKCEVAARIHEAGMESKLDAATCIENMNKISACKYGGCGILTEVTKRCRAICETLKVQIPEGVREDMEIYSLEDLESMLQFE